MSVDAHCHIDLHADPESTVQAAVDAGIRVVAVTTTPAAFPVSSKYSDESKGVFPALGMHPEVVGLRPQDIEQFGQHLDRVAWVGEVGLDGSRRFAPTWNLQVDVFRRVLAECTKAGGRLLSIHSRAAAGSVLEVLKEYPDAGTPVFHWFSGKTEELTQCVDYGSYFSVNSQMLDSKSGARIAARIPLNRLLTESDAPFARTDGRCSVVGDVIGIVRKIARLRGLQHDEVSHAVDENFAILQQHS